MASEQNRVILIAMDGSYHSELAFEWYNDQVRRDNDYLVVLTCFDRHSYGIQGYGIADSAELASQLQRDIDEHKKEAEKLEEKIKQSKVKGEVVTLMGKAGEAAIKLAHDRNAAMIICGARGHSKVRRTFIGSTSDYIIHHSDIPVVVCRHKAHINPSTERKS